jgi:hypothetical protein
MENITITRQKLYEMVWKESLTAISKRLNIPYSHLRKVCTEMNVPVPPNGHWSKLQFGKPVEIIELPQNYTGANEIKLFPDDKTTSSPKVLTFHKKSAADLIKEDETLPLKVPKTLTNPEELVLAAQKKLMEYKYSKYHDNGMVRHDGAFTIRVSRHNIGRALRFMNALLKLLRARGHNLGTKYTHSLYIDEVPCEFKLMEKTKKSSQETKWGFAQYESTGHLYFEIKGYEGRVWIDGKVLIEERLASILAKIESKVSEMLECWRQNAEHKREREQKERIIREHQERIENEKKAFKDLYKQAKRWDRAKFLREYIKAFEQNAIEKGELTDELRDWIGAAKQRVNDYDPLLRKYIP